MTMTLLSPDVRKGQNRGARWPGLHWKTYSLSFFLSVTDVEACGLSERTRGEVSGWFGWKTSYSPVPCTTSLEGRLEGWLKGRLGWNTSKSPIPWNTAFEDSAASGCTETLLDPEWGFLFKTSARSARWWPGWRSRYDCRGRITGGLAVWTASGFFLLFRLLFGGEMEKVPANNVSLESST